MPFCETICCACETVSCHKKHVFSVIFNQISSFHKNAQARFKRVQAAKPTPSAPPFTSIYLHLPPFTPSARWNHNGCPMDSQWNARWIHNGMPDGITMESIFCLFFNRHNQIGCPSCPSCPSCFPANVPVSRWDVSRESICKNHIDKANHFVGANKMVFNTGRGFDGFLKLRPVPLLLKYGIVKKQPRS